VQGKNESVELQAQQLSVPMPFAASPSTTKS